MTSDRLVMPQMEFSGNLSANWKMFKQGMKYYLDAIASSTSITSKRKVGILVTAMGRQGLDILNAIDEFDEDHASYNTMLALFDDHFNPKKNAIYKRYVFMTMVQKEQTGEQFIIDLKKQAAFCEFGDQRDKLIRDRIVVGIKSAELCRELLRESDLTLQVAEEKV